MATSALDLSNRDRAMASLADGVFDLLVVGGGITGCGIARDAAMRGLRVVLVEARDFASGTSSRSSKLIHGGLRYLAQGDIALVREAASERKILRTIAPHLAQMNPMLMPARSQGGLMKLRAGLFAFERLGGVPRAEHFEVFAAKHLAEIEPTLRARGIAGAIRYPEYLTDDARLVLANARAAHEAGAVLVNYAQVTRLALESGRVTGADITETLNAGRRAQVKAKLVINAAGPWADALRTLEGKGETALQLTKGIHIAFRHEDLPCRQTVVMAAGDKRGVFAVPRGGITYVGTTDTFYPKAEYWPQIEPGDIGYLLETVNGAFDLPKLDEGKIVSAWAGLRPLLAAKGKAPSEISRKEEILEGPGGMVTIAGGKLSAYRRMAEKVVDFAVRKLGVKAPPAATAERPLPGAVDPASAVRPLLARGLAPESAERLVRLYGSEAESIMTDGGDIAAEARHAVKVEGAVTLEDYWVRRSARAWFSEDGGASALAPAARAMAPLLGWTAEEEASQVATCRKRLGEEMLALTVGVRR
ncbi:MAG: glycerol-3-phosphate dehydrogenase/oxidase [Alphaproteobacteria bacterium]